MDKVKMTKRLKKYDFEYDNTNPVFMPLNVKRFAFRGKHKLRMDEIDISEKGAKALWRLLNKVAEKLGWK